MRVAKKILGADRADHTVERMVVDQNRSEDRPLRIRRLRQRPVECDVELRYGHELKDAQFGETKAKKHPQIHAQLLHRRSHAKSICVKENRVLLKAVLSLSLHPVDNGMAPPVT